MRNTNSSRRIYWRTSDIFRGAAIVVAVLAIAKLLVSIQTMIFITFLGILFGLAVSAGTDFLQKYKVPRSLGAVSIVLGFLGLLVGFGIWSGPTVKEQYRELRERLPQAVGAIDNWIAEHESGLFGKMILKATPLDPDNSEDAPEDASPEAADNQASQAQQSRSESRRQTSTPPAPATVKESAQTSPALPPQTRPTPPDSVPIPFVVPGAAGAADSALPADITLNQTAIAAATTALLPVEGQPGSTGGDLQEGQPEKVSTTVTVQTDAEPKDSLSRVKTLGEALARGMSGATEYVFPVITSTFAAITGIFLVLFLAIYFAIEPNTYRNGFLSMIPKPRRARWDQVLSASGTALKRWLITQLIAMLVIGIVTTVILLLLGVPAALPLGILAGLFEFIPTIGPILSAVPSIAMGFTVSPEKAFVVLLVYVGIQFVENNFLIPILMKEGVDLPPVVTIVAQSVMAFVFGFMGLFVAVPALVLGSVMVKMLYVEDVIENDRRGPDDDRTLTVDLKTEEL